MIKLHLLSTPKVEMNGVIENIKLNAPSSLLIYLAFRKDWIPRTELAFLYKPDELETDAKRYLRLLIHRAKNIPWAANLEVERSQLRLLINTDVDEYLQANKDEKWTEATALYGGKFLNGLSLSEVFSFNSWLELERTELEFIHQNALKHSAESLSKEGKEKEASAELLKLLDYDWTNEEVVRIAMRSAYASGQDELAKKIYKRFAEVLKEELDLEPLEETKAIFQGLGSLDGLEPKQTKTPSFTVVSLPAQSTRFIGRKADLSKLNHNCSTEGCRLLSIVGLGGIGKTRLGLELARSQVGSFPDGVFFIALADIKANMLAATIARALNISISDDSKTKELLFKHLSGKRCLLVLDNFEHILEAKALLNQMLESSPALKIVLTTRVSLGLKSEHIYELQGLDYPENSNQTNLQDFDAIKLFLSAAKRVAPSLPVDDNSLEVIAKICKTVEGMPLAIELASAWLRVISIEQLFEQIQKSLDMLSSEHSDIAPRHRNVRAVFDYSWQRLSDKQKEILKRLAIFQGGFNLEAAESVANAHLGHLLNMTNESFIRAHGNNRFSMHELIRKYVREKLLNDSKIYDSYRLEHALYFAQMLSDCNIEEHEQSKNSVNKIDKDLENIRLAWSVLVDNCSLAELLKSLRSIDYYFGNRGLYGEAKEFYIEHISALEKNCEPVGLDYAKLLAGLKFRTATTANRQDQSELAYELFAQALEIANKHELAKIRQRCLFELGVLSYKKGDFNKAEELFNEAKQIGEDLADDRITVDAVNALGLVAKATDKFDEARAHFGKAIELFTRLGHKRGAAMAYSNLGNLEEALGNYQTAQQMYYKSLPIFEDMNFIPGIAVVKTNIGVTEYRLGNMQTALDMSLEALELKRKMRGQRGIVKSYLNLARIYFATKEPETAVEYLYKSLSLATENSFEPSLIEVLSYFVKLLFSYEDKALAMQISKMIARHPKAEAVHKQIAEEYIESNRAVKNLKKLDLYQLVNRVTNSKEKLKR